MSTTRSRPHRSTARSRVLAVVAVAALVVSACGDSDADSDDVDTSPGSSPSSTSVGPSTTLADADGSAAPPTTGATDGTTSDDDPGLGDRCRGAQLPSGGQYAVTNIPADDPDGGLVARPLPDASSEPIDVLAEGTIVDTFIGPESCAVTSEGAVWWDIGTPQLATGGWVNTAFLAPVGGDDEQDSFDLEQAQIACVYEGIGDACDLLTTFGYPADQNYGLGNSISQAPEAVIDADCRAGDALACAEQASRGGG
jgi:hypothetical protein